MLSYGPPLIRKEGLMRSNRLRILIGAAIVMITASFPTRAAVDYVYPDCSESQVQCFMTCTSEGCVYLITPDPFAHLHDFCYPIGTSGCMGGQFHRCCE